MRNTALLITTMLLLHCPVTAFAHGGFEKRAGDTTVYITQTPVSPLVGEAVHINLVFQDSYSLARWNNLDVQLKLIDTHYGDETKDKVLKTETKTTDANGSLNLAYTFTKENYFDLDLLFINPKTGKQEQTGFLIEPRNRGNTSFLWLVFLLIAAGVVVITYISITHRANNRQSQSRAKIHTHDE